VRFGTPAESLVNKSVKSISVPGSEGMLGISFGQAPLIAELKPGPVTVVVSETETKKYFISGGFIDVQPGSIANITVAEAIPFADLDLVQAKKLLEDQTASKAKATTDVERITAQIGIDVYSSILFWGAKA